MRGAGGPVALRAACHSSTSKRTSCVTAGPSGTAVCSASAYEQDARQRQSKPCSAVRAASFAPCFNTGCICPTQSLQAAAATQRAGAAKEHACSTLRLSPSRATFRSESTARHRDAVLSADAQGAGARLTRALVRRTSRSVATTSGGPQRPVPVPSQPLLTLTLSHVLPLMPGLCARATASATLAPSRHIWRRLRCGPHCLRHGCIGRTLTLNALATSWLCLLPCPLLRRQLCPLPERASCPWRRSRPPSGQASCRALPASPGASGRA